MTLLPSQFWLMVVVAIGLIAMGSLVYAARGVSGWIARLLGESVTSWFKRINGAVGVVEKLPAHVAKLESQLAAIRKSLRAHRRGLSHLRERVARLERHANLTPLPDRRERRRFRAPEGDPA